MGKVNKRHESLVSLKLIAVFKMLLELGWLSEKNNNNKLEKLDSILPPGAFAVPWQVWDKGRASEYYL